MQLREHAAAMQSPLEIPFPSNWLESLYQLLKASPNAKYRKVHALLVAVADGNFEGGMMLYWLLKLLPKSKRADGAVYKSAVQWQAEYGLTKNQVKRVNKSILSRFFDITVKKAQGAPTNHYCLKAWAFLHRLGDVLNLPAYYLLLKMHKAANGFATKQPMDLLQSSQSLTDESTIQKTDVVNESDSIPGKKIVELPPSTPEQMRVITMLVKAGLQNAQALPFALLPETTVQACINSTEKAVKAGRVTLQKRVGYLITALRNQKKAHTAPPPTPLPAEVAGEQDSDFADSHEDKLDTSWRLPKPEHAEAAPVNERLNTIIAGNMTVQAAWSAAYHQLELQLDRASFDTWLRSAVLLDYEADEKKFVIGVHNTYARDMLQHRLYRNVARILRDVTGIEVAIRFEVYKNGKIIPADETEPHDAPLQRFLRSNSDAD